MQPDWQVSTSSTECHAGLCTRSVHLQSASEHCRALCRLPSRAAGQKEKEKENFLRPACLTTLWVCGREDGKRRRTPHLHHKHRQQVANSITLQSLSSRDTQHSAPTDVCSFCCCLCWLWWWGHWPFWVWVARGQPAPKPNQRLLIPCHTFGGSGRS